MGEAATVSKARLLRKLRKAESVVYWLVVAPLAALHARQPRLPYRLLAGGLDFPVPGRQTR